AGINDWGGVSPVSADFVNPEAPWPQIGRLSRETAAAGKHLVARLPLYPAYMRDKERWLDSALHTRALQLQDSEGFARNDGWSP
ncbi:MAG TPA: 7,8-didemethyl-8-hydroxy-5-deazariboflavin synthase, partial [Alphaproteobacteria bacterium]|nr:7,8-didemethyl-8-hydroxy-5-deazariboflavin synthase [Alphaproteobacteria bacterium]